MTPIEHSILSVRDFGGVPEDYQKIHDFLDSTKAHYYNFKHRAILHNSFGMILCETIFGPGFANSDKKLVSVREIARRHIAQDCNNYVPTVADWLNDLSPSKPWAHIVSKKDLLYLKNYKSE